MKIDHRRELLKADVSNVSPSLGRRANFTKSHF